MDNKTILIIGASSELGLEFIRANHEKYDKIISHYFSNDADLLSIKNDIGEKIVPIQGDLSNISSIQEFIDNIAKISDDIQNILHLPAPKYKLVKFAKIPINDYVDSYNVQVLSIAMILKKFITKMSKKKYGKVVFILSSCTNNNPPKYANDYVTNKYALLGMMKSLASEYADKKLNINAISPSMMETKFLDNVPELIIHQNKENSPMKRNAEIKDIIPAIEYFLSDSSEYVTGQNIVIAGGN